MPEVSTKSNQGEVLYDITKPLRSMTDDEAAQYNSTNFKYAYDKKRGDNERNERYDDIYAALDPRDTRVDETTQTLEEDERLYANSFLPVVAARIDTATANCWNGIFYGPEYMSGEAGDAMDEIAISTKIVPHMQATHRQSGLKNQVFKAILGACCHDYAITIGFWHLKAGYIPKREELIDVLQLGNIKQPRRRVENKMQWVPDKIDRFEIRYIPYKFCVHDPDSVNGLEDSEYFFHWWWEPFGNLKDQERTEERPYGRYYNLDQVEEYVKAQFSKELNSQPDELSRENFIRRTRVGVIRCITEHHKIETVGPVVINRQDLFDWPIQLWKYHEKEAKFNGIGLAQRTERMQLDINADASDRRDYWNRALNPVSVIDQSLLGQQSGKLVLSTGKVFIRPTESNQKASDLIHTVPVAGQPPPSPGQEMSLQLRITDDITGVSENDLGRFASGRRSAREAGQVDAGSAVRFGAVTKRFEDNCMVKIYQMQFLFNQLYMTREDRFKHHGEYGTYSMLVTPEDYKLTGSCKFMARGSSRMQEDAIRLQQFMTGMDRALNFPQYHNLDKVFLAMWKKLDPLDFNEFVKDPTAQANNIPPEIENQIMAAGKSVEVSPANDHQRHSAVHGGYMMSPDYQLWPDAMKRRMEFHKQQHDQAAMQTMGQGMGGRSNALTAMPQGGAGISQGQRDTSMGVTP